MRRPANIRLITLAVLFVVLSAVGVLGGLLFTIAPPRAAFAPVPIETEFGSPRFTSFPLQPADRHEHRETPAVAVDSQDRAVCAWASRTSDDEFTLFLSTSSAASHWKAPSAFRKVKTHRFTIPGRDGKAMTLSTHVQPRLAVHENTITLGWTEAEDGGPKVRFHVARSTDGGQTFSEPMNVTGDEAVRPGYTALAVGPDGTTAAAWLDGRNRAQQPFAALSLAGGLFDDANLVHAGPENKGICPCCDLAVARTASATFVGFRNAEAGRRDIVVSRSGADGFEPPVAVSEDRWELQGCPHDGPCLAATEKHLYAIWMGGHTGERRVYLAVSPLDRLAFVRLPLQDYASREQGHPKLVALPDSHLIAVWDESLTDDAEASPAAEKGKIGGHGHGPNLTGRGRAIVLTRSRDAGGSFSKALPLKPREGAFQVQPALAAGAYGSRVIVSWNEFDSEGKRVVIAELSPY